jgi:hypothetical protein
MSSRLYWVEGGWPGKLALAARPRGGDWLEAEITSWQGAGINTVLSLLTAEEERDLNLINEKHEVKKGGMKFLSLPIQDREVPSSESEVRATVLTLTPERTLSYIVVRELVAAGCWQPAY